MPQPETVALKLAHILIPQRRSERNQLFTEGARDLLAGLMTCLFVERGEMSLHDVRSTIQTKEGLRKALERHPQTRFLAEWYLSSDRSFEEIRSILTEELARHDDIAGLSFRPK
jgi:hypothetical protein